MELIDREEVIKTLLKFETVKELGSYIHGKSTCGGQASVAYIEGGRTDILWVINKLQVYNIKEDNMEKYTFTIENSKGDSTMSFEVYKDNNNEIKIGQTNNCSLADSDYDYIFNTDNQLFRIQAD